MRKLALCTLLLATFAFASEDTIITKSTSINAAKNGTVAVPNILRYTGYLIDTQGNSVTGIHSVTASLYTTQQGGTAFWQETQQVTTDASGRYSILIGATTPGGIPLDLFFSGEARWIAISSPDSAPTARALFASVPYALKAHDADSVGGIPASQLMRINPDLSVQTAFSPQPNSAGVTPSVTADLQAEALTRQQADVQVLQQAKNYTDASVSTIAIGNLNQANSAVNGEQLRAKQSEQNLYAQTSTEAARAQASENLLGVQLAAVNSAMLSTALPQGAWIISPSSNAPSGYLFTGLTLQVTGSPSPEAAIKLRGGAQSQTSFTLYIHMKSN